MKTGGLQCTYPVAGGASTQRAWHWMSLPHESVQGSVLPGPAFVWLLTMNEQAESAAQGKQPPRSERTA